MEELWRTDDIWNIKLCYDGYMYLKSYVYTIQCRVTKILVAW